MCYTAASDIFTRSILLTVAIETDNPQSKDMNSTELNVTCCHLGITVNTTWRERSIISLSNAVKSREKTWEMN